MRMHTKLENGVLRNGQQPGSAVNSIIDLGKLEAVKTPSGRRAPRFDKHIQFRAEMAVNTQTVFEISLLNIVILTRKYLSLPHTFSFSCFQRGFWATTKVSMITNSLKEEAWAFK